MKISSPKLFENVISITEENQRSYTISIICELRKQAEDFCKSNWANISNIDIIITLCETPDEYYQQSGPLEPINTQLAVYLRHMPH